MMNQNSFLDIKVFKTAKDKDYRKSFLNPNFLIPPFRIVIVGSTGSGKTNLIKNILFNKSFGFRDYFDNAFVFIGSGDDYREYKKLTNSLTAKEYNDKTKDYFKSKKIPLSDKYQIEQSTTEADLLDIYDELEQTDYNNESSFFVFDDMITDKLLKNAYQMNVMDKLFVQGRHINASTIISTQKLKAIKTNLRYTNSSHLILFFGLSREDVAVVAKENSSFLSEQDIINIYRDNANKPYKFIIIYQKNPAGKYIQNDKGDWIA